MTPPTNLMQLVDLFIDIGLKVIPLLGAACFLFFVWGIARFIKASGDEKEVKDSKNILIWGVIGMFVIATIWGILTFLRSELGFSSNLGIPQINI